MATRIDHPRCDFCNATLVKVTIRSEISVASNLRQAICNEAH
jgi:hypothetical protein